MVLVAGFGMTKFEPSGSLTAMLELCHLEVNINAVIIISLIFNPDLYQNFTQHKQRDPNKLVC
jgi:hypothetical protein